MTPDVKPPPEGQRQPFRVVGVILAYSKADATEQFRKAIERLGGTVIGVGASDHLEGGITVNG